MLATEGGDFYATADGATTDADADGYADLITEVFEEAPSDGLDVDITDLTAAIVGKEAEFLLSDVVDSDGNQMFTASDYVVVNDGQGGVESLVLSTQYTGASQSNEGELLEGETNTLEASEIEWFTGLENGSLSTNLGGTKNSIDATTGSATSISGVGAVGDTFSFNFIFDSGDYNPFEDFAYVAVK